MYKLEKVFVVPGEGRKTPLPLPGGGTIPATGKTVPRSIAVERLIRSGDLVVTEAPPAPAPQEPAPAPVPEPAPTKTAKG